MLTASSSQSRTLNSSRISCDLCIREQSDVRVQFDQCASCSTVGSRSSMRRTERKVAFCDLLLLGTYVPQGSRDEVSWALNTSQCGRQIILFKGKTHETRQRMAGRNSLCQFFGSRLAGIFVLTLVLGKLNPEALLRVCDSLEGGYRSLELATASSAHRDSRDCAKPFEHPKMAFLHEQQFPTGRHTDVSFIAQTQPRPSVHNGS